MVFFIVDLSNCLVIIKYRKGIIKTRPINLPITLCSHSQKKIPLNSVKLILLFSF